jgi:hypothetical protein
MKRRNVLVLTILVALCGFSVSAMFGVKQHQDQKAQMPSQGKSTAFWKEVYRNPEQLVRGVDLIVLGQAIDKQPGRTAYSANGEDALPFEVVAFRVLNSIKGKNGDGVVYVERAGGVDPEGNQVILSADGGDFELGNSYLLFLKRQEDGPYYYQVNDQGRYQLEGGRLKAVDKDDEVSSNFHDRSLEEGIRIVNENKDKGTGPKPRPE